MGAPENLQKKIEDLMLDHYEKDILLELARAFERQAAEDKEKYFQSIISGLTLKVIALEQW